VARLEKSALFCGSPHQNPSKMDSTRGACSFWRANIWDRQGKKPKQYADIARIFADGYTNICRQKPY
jgi:hypothetical protein